MYCKSKYCDLSMQINMPILLKLMTLYRLLEGLTILCDIHVRQYGVLPIRSHTPRNFAQIKAT